MKEITDFAKKVIDNVEKVIIGKHEEVKIVLVSLLCEGHLLIEDVPGVGKTVLAKAIARSLGCSFSRIQCTPDLLPSDITGLNVYNQKTNEFEFRPGPICNQIVLADEINRATPKTQSALLECMEERQITTDGITRKLSRPFMVIATQNSIEYEGTFLLPEAQLDRFLFKISIGYPDQEAEKEILVRQKNIHPIEGIDKVVDSVELLNMQKLIAEVHVDSSLKDYIVKIVHKTRENHDLYLGASPRGSLALYKGSKALASMSGRDYVIPDDIKFLVLYALSHRVIAKFESTKNSTYIKNLFDKILEEVPVPV